MRIESIGLTNYRLFREVWLANLSSMAIVVGANGSGKSTLFDALSFLKDALAENVAHAVARRGGYQELVSRGEAGPIAITIAFSEEDGNEAHYLLQINEERGRPIVGLEMLSVVHRSGDPKSLRVVNVMEGRGSAMFLEEESDSSWVGERCGPEGPEYLGDQRTRPVQGVSERPQNSASSWRVGTFPTFTSATRDRARRPATLNTSRRVATTWPKWHSF